MNKRETVFDYDQPFLKALKKYLNINNAALIIDESLNKLVECDSRLYK